MNLGNRRIRNHARLTLRTKINGLILLDLLIVLVLVLTIFSYIIIQIEFENIGQKAVSVANVVADTPTIILAFREKDPSQIIQPIAEEMRKESGAEFIVVGNMDLIRYSHPNPNNIGLHMVGDDNDLVLNGQASITRAVGTLGLSVRGKAPIFDFDNHQIGVVSVGFLVRDLWIEIFDYLALMGGVGILGLGIGLGGAYLLSGHIKKQILNMEPSEIALMTEQQSAIMESIREGIVAVDLEGKITACNQEAKRVLGIDTEDLLAGTPITQVIPNSRLPEVLATGRSHLDQPMIMGNTLVIVNRIPVLHQEKVIGAVSTFRDKMELEQIDSRLADVGRFVDDLRSQRHEFMNRLHTIAGLIKIKDYDLAAKLIDQVNNEQQQAFQFFLTRIRDSAVVGILIGKMHRAKELGIQLNINPQSRVNNTCPHRELVVTILGNAIENSFEAMSEKKDQSKEQSSITVYIHDEDSQLVLKVTDTGPGIDPEIKDKILMDGVSTKGENRGFGLALISRRIEQIQGSLKIESSERGTILEAMLPK